MKTIIIVPFVKLDYISSAIKLMEMVFLVHAIKIVLIMDFMPLKMKRIEINAVLALIIVKNVKMKQYVINVINHSC
jgi:hypothetical protein